MAAQEIRFTTEGGRRIAWTRTGEGPAVGLAHAAEHPATVRQLVVYGGYASGAAIADVAARAAIVDLVRRHWGLGSRALADIFMPSADAAAREAFVTFQRDATTAERAASALEAVYGFDVSAELVRVGVPTTVLHRRGDRAIPFALGRELAEAVPDARFLALDGDDHFPWLGDAGAVLEAMLGALGSTYLPSARDAELTRRETEVLALVARGLSNREIAEQLVLSPHTVHRHVANVRTKLGLPTRAAAVAAATRRGLL